MRRLRTLVALGVMLVVLAAAGCAPEGEEGEDTAGDDPADAEEPDGSAEGGGDQPEGSMLWDAEFEVVEADPGHLDGILSGAVVTAVYDQLVTFEGADVSEVKPQLATSWEISDDLQTFTFELREEAEFADGTPVTAEDVVFSFRRLKNLDASPSFRMDGLEVNAVDDHTVEIQSEEPDPGLLTRLTKYSFSVLNSERAREEGAVATPNASTEDSAQEYLNNNSLGSGPYVLESLEPESRYVLRANDNYWGDSGPNLEEIVIRNVPSETQLVNVRAGEPDLVMDLTPAQAQTIENPEYSVDSSPSIRFFFVFMNKDEEVAPVVSDEDFQEAVRYALDYPSIVELGGDGAQQIPGFVPEIVEGSLPRSEALERDLDSAESALERGGFEDADVQFSFASDNPRQGLDQGVVAERIQSHLAEAGISAELDPQPLATMLDDVRAGNVPFGIWTANRLPDPSAFLIFCPGSQWGERTRWEEGDNPEIDALCDEAAAAPPGDREEEFHELQRALLEQGSVVPLFHMPQMVVSKDRLTNAEYNAASLIDLTAIDVES